MSNAAQAQQGSNKESSITLEDIESIKTVKDEQKQQMARYLKSLNENIQNTSEGSPEHQSSLQKLKEFTAKLRAQLYKQQQTEHAQQAQSRLVQQGQVKQQPSQGQGLQQGSQAPNQQVQYSGEVIQRARNLQVPYPPDMPQADVQKYVSDQKKQYAQALSQHENMEKVRQQQMQAIESKRSQGQDVSQEMSKVAKAEDYLRKAKIAIEGFERKHMENRARQQAVQQNPANGGAASTAGPQNASQQSQPARANQPGPAVNTSVESAMSPTSPTQQQQHSQSQQQQTSQHANSQPSQGQSLNMPQNPQPNSTANPPRPSINVQQANQAMQLAQHSPHAQPPHSGVGGPGGTGVQPLSHETAMAYAARSYSQSQAAPPSSSQPGQGPTPTTGHSSAPPRQAQTPQSAGASAIGISSNSSVSNLGITASGANQNKFPIPKTLNITNPMPVQMGAARPTLGGPVNGAPGMVGQPAVQKHPGFVLEGEGDRVLSKKKLDELVRQVTGGGEGPGESLTPEVEEVSEFRYGLYCTY